jgi:anti-anti-sigma factor
MPLILENQKIGDVIVLRCRGRIVTGDEVRSLQAEFEKLRYETKNFVLQLAEVSFIDSGGLGALVRLFGVLQNAGGDLKLCQLPPFLLQVLQVTNLTSLFHLYSSEKEAVEAFSEWPSREETSSGSATRVVCIDTSHDLLAYLNALLKRSGYEAFTTRYPSEAATLVKATKASLVICGPGMQTNKPAIEKFRQIGPTVKLLLLEPDFSTAEASQAGVNLVTQVRSLLQAQQ